MSSPLCARESHQGENKVSLCDQLLQFTLQIRKGAGDRHASEQIGDTGLSYRGAAVTGRLGTISGDAGVLLGLTQGRRDAKLLPHDQLLVEVPDLFPLVARGVDHVHSSHAKFFASGPDFHEVSPVGYHARSS